MQILTEDEFSRYWRLRWTRGDGDRYVRHDAERYLKPEYPERKLASSDTSLPADLPADWLEADELEFRCELASLRLDLALLRLSMRAQKAVHHSNFQPRVPAGNSDGGQFAPEGGQPTRLSQLGNELPGISGPHGGQRGHHYVPKGVFKKYPLSDDALRVFDKTRSGRLETDAIGALRGHYWDGPKGAHRVYNDAVEQLFDRYLSENNIRPQLMTGDQARSFLRHIERSEDPRVRDYNATIKLLRMLRIFRGRGNE